MPLAHHVGLVMKTAGHRDIDDARRGAQEQPTGTLEAKHAGRRLGRNPELAAEALAKVPAAEANRSCELLNGHASVTDRQAAPGPRQGIGSRDWSQPSQENSI